MGEKSYIGNNIGYVFVYNTLKVGGELSGLFDGYRIAYYKAVIVGSLYNGGFALILDGKNFVLGELHRYTNFKDVIENMDELEHYYPDKEDIDSLYLRKKVNVRYVKNGGLYKQRAYVYEYNGDIVYENHKR